jgi:hypothetical protein
MISSSRLQIGAVALIVAAIFVNLLQFDIETGPHRFSPLARHEAADITKIGDWRSRRNSSSRCRLFCRGLRGFIPVNHDASVA